MHTFKLPGVLLPANDNTLGPSLTGITPIGDEDDGNALAWLCEEYTDQMQQTCATDLRQDVDCVAGLYAYSNARGSFVCACYSSFDGEYERDSRVVDFWQRRITSRA